MKNECIYPDWEGDMISGIHRYDKDGFCIICGYKKITERDGDHVFINNGSKKLRKDFKTSGMNKK
jgi:hypothetical protein